MPVPEDRASVGRQLLRDTAYAALRDAIVDGTLAAGEQLHDADLCAWLGLSRSPVREALARLQDEGLVETSPQRYTRVAPVVRRDARDAFPVLAALHALATELAVPRLAPDDVDELRAHNAQFVAAVNARDRGTAYAADERFHEVFVRVAQNRDVVRSLDRISARLHRFEHCEPDVLPGLRSVAQHEAIVSRAVEGNAVGAASAVRDNWMTLGVLMDRSLAAR